MKPPLLQGLAQDRLAPASLEKAVARLEAIAASLGGSAFSLFSLIGSPDRQRLVPVVDSAYPAISDETRLLAAGAGSELGRHAGRSTTPCHWRCVTNDRVTDASLAASIAPALPDRDGIALPVFDDGARTGLLVVYGRGFSPSNEALCGAHMDAMSLFTAVLRLRAAPAAKVPPITRRELECLRLTARGMTSEEIAGVLGLSVHTANQHLSSTTQKLNAVNRMHAVAKALRLGLID